MSTLFKTAGLPGHHENTLIIRMRPDAAPALERAALPAFAAGGAATGAPGLSALKRFEAAGLIRAVHLCSRQAAARAEHAPGRVMVPMAASMRGAAATDRLSGVSIVEVSGEAETRELADALSHDPSVESVGRLPMRYLLAARTPSRKSARNPAAAIPAMPAAVPPPASSMWNLAKIRWDQARVRPGFQDAAGVTVAVLDTGIELEHPDLLGRVDDYVFRYDGVNAPSEAKDYVGHGTHVAGTIGAAIGNQLGINGICTCRLRAFKIFSDEVTYIPQIDQFAYVVHPVMYLRALADCLEQRVSVVNLSIGGGGAPDQNEAAIFSELIAGGTTVVAAMGNEREIGSPISYPAAIPGVIAVGATSLDDGVARFSNRGAHISVCAPGVSIWSTLPTYPGQTGFQVRRLPGGRPVTGAPLSRDTDYDAWDGTSMASPHVAAAAALFLAKMGPASPAAVRDALIASADKVPGMNGRDFHQDYGFGRINLDRLLS